MGSRSEAKAHFRREALRILRRIPRGRARIEDHRLRREVMEYIDRLAPRSVLLYLPLPLEVDLRPIIKQLRKRGIDVFVPFMEGKSIRPVKYRLPLQKKAYGIYEPKISRQYRVGKIDIAFIPIVGTDPTVRRIGFGKGFYDRYFDKEKKRIGRVVFLQRRLCYSPIVLTEAHDVRGDDIIAGPMILIQP
ncbi:5-formyltetrahydrofolate cyclo-ligase [Nitratifractor salsuginis]|uniref:5-formyltetrahydrofolate cyclo-ligase n=1 Tax=Nitratifractor salsuginis (strain DSM 16511 / JCM 12458 / E9I37-1) TaxID=749222 RepID=E6WZZ8_NITSE|nr:5-formyltetrahydrofolate cyclo-ligase [Nitratifractor salsuginis]ADV45656.1 5-formyltetrahydrofolate cyclo-ligase [Nitratifractor salsuginis DSM 16511]